MTIELVRAVEAHRRVRLRYRPASGLEWDGEVEPWAVVVLGSTSNPSMHAQEWLASIPFPFRIEAGPELRAAVVELAARCQAAIAAG